MSNFVAALVRKGAGLASPVALRPALGPHNIPAPIEAERLTPFPSVSSTATPIDDNASKLTILDTTVEQPLVALRPRGVVWEAPEPEKVPSEIEPTALIPQTHPTTHPKPGPRSHDAQVKLPDVVRLTPQTNDGDREMSGAVPALPPALSEQSNAPRAESSSTVPKTSSASQYARHDQSFEPWEQTRNRGLSSVKVAPRQESQLVMPSVTKFSASVPRQNRGAEPRSIQVKIGRVEIRSSQLAPPLRQSRKAAQSGFADLGVARAYLDRGGW
jgi:hypothetical protein